MTASATFRIQGEDATASAFASVVKNANTAADGVKKAFEATFVGLSAAGLVEFTQYFIDAGAQIEEASKKAGISGNAFSELAYAAKQNGLDADSLSQALARMNRALSEAATGAKLPNQALAALGLTIGDLQKLSPDKQFELLADRITSLQSPADKSRAGMELFGRGAAELVPLLAQGASGIEDLRTESEKLGAAFSDEQLKNFEEAHKAITALESSLSGLASTVVGDVAPGLTEVLNTVTKIVSGDAIEKLNAQIGVILAHRDGFLAPLYSDASYKADTDKIAALQAQIDALSGNSSKLPFNFGLKNDSWNGKGGPGYMPEVEPFKSSDNFKISADDLKLDPFTQESADRLKELQDFLAALPNSTGLTAAPKLLDQFNLQTSNSLEKAQTQYSDTKVELEELFKSGIIDSDDFTQKMKENGEKFDAAFDIQPIVINLKKLPEAMGGATLAVQEFTDGIENALKQTMDETGNFGENLLRNLLKALEDKALYTAIDDLGTYLKEKLDPTGTGSGFGGFLMGLLGNGGSSYNGFNYDGGIGLNADAESSALVSGGLPGFATGGAFTVGGRSGTDTNLVAFRATKGESVSIGRQGQVGGMPAFSPTYNIDARGADKSMMPQIAAAIAASAAQSKRDILQAWSRAGLRAPNSI